MSPRTSGLPSWRRLTSSTSEADRLTPEYVETGNAICRWLRLDDRVTSSDCATNQQRAVNRRPWGFTCSQADAAQSWFAT